MLLGNYTSQNSNPGKAVGGFTNLFANYKPSSWYSFYDPDVASPDTRLNSKACFPTGTEPSYSWMLAPKGGEFSSTTTINGGSSMTSALIIAKQLASSMSGSGDISSALSLLTALSSNLSGTGAITSSMALSLTLASSMSGSGSIASSMSLLVPFAVTLSGSGTLTANLKGKASLAADIFVNSGTATVTEIVAGVWNALAADYNNSGTMGEKMNAAGTAGDPWTTDLSGYNTTGTAGKIVKQIKSIGQAGL